MQPAATQALDAWQTALSATQAAAVAALRAAFPPLEPASPRCCEVRMEFDQPGTGAGTVCLDTDGRVTIDFIGVPNPVAGEAVDDVWRIAWFEGADGPLSEADPGTYSYEDESTHAEYEIVLGDAEPAKVYAAYAPVPDAVALLDALTRATRAEE